MSLLRDPSKLCGEEFELLVIGAGILGACVARDAALRGLRVALIDQADFGSGASANSLKIVHGGFRYLRHGDLGAVRLMSRERSTWLRIAPHLVEPLPILVPARQVGLQRRGLLQLAALVNDAVAWDRNRGLPETRGLPRSTLLEREDALRQVPEMARYASAGALQFWDAQMYSAERLVLEHVLASQQSGAAVANYMAAETALRSGHRLIGVRVRDKLSGDLLDVRARTVVNATGRALLDLASALTDRPQAGRLGFALALNLVIPHRGHRVAFAVPARPAEAQTERRDRFLFFVPWRDCLLIGTAHRPATHGSPGGNLQEEDVLRLLADVNAALPELELRPEDIRLVHFGHIPCARDGMTGSRPDIRPVILEHPGTPNLLSVATTKYTLARHFAEKIVDRVLRILGRPHVPSRTADVPLPGSPEGPLPALLGRVTDELGPSVPSEVVEHLVRTYGARSPLVLEHRRRDPLWRSRPVPEAPVLRLQWTYAADAEMAVTAEDLVWRRTELGPCGHATARALREAATVLACERDAQAARHATAASPRPPCPTS